MSPTDKPATEREEIERILPWQHLGGPAKKYLLDHLNQAMELDT